MRLLPATLSMRLTLGFVVIVAVLGAIYVGLAVVTANFLVRQVGEQLNRHLASGLVHGYGVFENGELQHDEVRALFHELMVVNPNIEMYLVDLEGRIIAFSAPEEIVRLERVDVEPIRRIIAGRDDETVLGDDPRNPGVRKPITVATVREGSVVSGYLYIVIGGQAFDHIYSVLRDSYALKLAGLVAIVGTALSVIAALVLFSLITKRIRRLSAKVDAFVSGEFKTPLDGRDEEPAGGDEIARLEQNIHAMADRISTQLRQLERADTTRRDMIANISHDLRTPIAAIQGYAETALLNGTELSDQTRRYLELAQANIQRLSSLIDQLFELSRLDDPSLALNLEDVSLAELLHDVAQKHRVTADRKGIDLRVEVAPDIPPVRADIGLIERLLDNLIGNAVKFVGPEGHVDLSLTQQADGVHLAVCDDGPGIEAADQARVFQRHFRKPAKHNGNAQGAGLGLAIAQRVVELHGGTIGLASRAGAGARFDVVLPA